MFDKIRNMGTWLLTLIYPSDCVMCKRLLRKNERYVCGECRVKVEYIAGVTCMKCGKEVTDREQEYCQDCSKHIRTYIKGFPAMEYKEPVSDGLWEFKYNNMRSYGRYFASEIVKAKGKDIKMVNPEVLIPIPVHKSKLIKRGYNQAELLADELGSMLNIPVEKDILKRTINTLPQKELDNQERENNLKKAFVCGDKIVKYNKVMLVDDIYTTGATIEACAGALKNAGIKQIYYTSVCIGRGNYYGINEL